MNAASSYSSVDMLFKILVDTLARGIGTKTITLLTQPASPVRVTLFLFSYKRRNLPFDVLVEDVCDVFRKQA